MAVERTFSIIKPDATRRNLTGKINARFEEKGLRIVAQKRIWMSRQQAEQFYGVHKARPFFGDLCSFMTSGPVVERRHAAAILGGDQAVDQHARRPALGLPNALLARLDRIGRAHIDIDPGDGIGVTAYGLCGSLASRGKARGKARQQNCDDRGKPSAYRHCGGPVFGYVRAPLLA